VDTIDVVIVGAGIIGCSTAFELSKLGLKVEVIEKEKAATAEKVFDLASFVSLGDVEHGKKVFKKCAACHSIKQGGKNKIGPALWSVMQRKSGELSDYNYSKALINHGKTWSFEELNGFLLKPATWIKGNKMGFAGLKDEKDRSSVILYMNESSDQPLSLP